MYNQAPLLQHVSQADTCQGSVDFEKTQSHGNQGRVSGMNELLIMVAILQVTTAMFQSVWLQDCTIAHYKRLLQNWICGKVWIPNGTKMF